MSTNEIPKVCDYHGRDNEPCYGEINEYYDGDKWIAWCEGHQAVPGGGAYVPQDPVRRLIFSQQNERIRVLETENVKLIDIIYDMSKTMYPDPIEIPAERLEILK